VELNKQQRVMVAVLTVAGIALAMDRFVIGSEAAGPSQAAAQPSPLVSLAAAPAERVDLNAETANSGAKAIVERQSVAQQLGTLKSPQDVAGGFDDAFWDASRPIEVIEIAAANEVPPAPQAKPLDDLATRHALTAILTTPAGPIAVVDGRALRVDRPTGGLTLRGVEGRSTALIEIAGQLVRLEIRRDAREQKPVRAGGTSDVR